MHTAEELINALDLALVAARSEYRSAVLALSIAEAGKGVGDDRAPANVDHIHHARTRMIALNHAHEELAHMIDEGGPLNTDV